MAEACRGGPAVDAFVGRPVGQMAGYLIIATCFGNSVEWPICRVGAGTPGVV